MREQQRGRGPNERVPKLRPSKREVAGVDWVVADGWTKVCCKVHPDPNGGQLQAATIQAKEPTCVGHRQRTSGDSKLAGENRSAPVAQVPCTLAQSLKMVARGARASRVQGAQTAKQRNALPKTRRRESPVADRRRGATQRKLNLQQLQHCRPRARMMKHGHHGWRHARHERASSSQE